MPLGIRVAPHPYYPRLIETLSARDGSMGRGHGGRLRFSSPPAEGIAPCCATSLACPAVSHRVPPAVKPLAVGRWPTACPGSSPWRAASCLRPMSGPAWIHKPLLLAIKTTIGATRTTGQTVSRDQMTRLCFPRPLTSLGGPLSIRTSLGRSAPWSSTAPGGSEIDIKAPLTVLSTSSIDSGTIFLIDTPLTFNAASTPVAARSPSVAA